MRERDAKPNTPEPVPPTPATTMRPRAGDLLTFVYSNWQGATSVRNVLQLGIWHGSTRWHRRPQWLLHAYDLDKGEERDFALADMSPAPIGAGGDA